MSDENQIIKNINKVMKEKFGIKRLNIQYKKYIEKELGKGKNATVYLIKVKNKYMAAKVQRIFFDTPLIKINTDTEFVSQTAINELVISNEISKIKQINIQKLYGYSLNTKELVIFNEFIPYTFEYIVDMSTSSSSISLLLLHLLLTFHTIFQHKHIKGYHIDFKVKNCCIAVKETNVKDMKYEIGNCNVTLPIKKHLPVIIDFGSSIIIEVDGEKNIIYRHMWRSGNMKFKSRPSNEELIDEFDPSFDLYIFFKSFERYHTHNIVVSTVYYDLLEKEGIKMDNVYIKNNVTIEKILNHTAIKLFIKSIK